MGRKEKKRVSQPTDNIDLSILEDSLGFLIRISMRKIYLHFYEEFDDTGIKPGEFSILWLIHLNPNIRQGVLAKQLMIKRAYMSNLIRAFEKNNLVKRTIPDTNRRAVELALTQPGIRFIEKHKELFFSYTGWKDTHLTKKEKNQLVTLLKKFLNL